MKKPLAISYEKYSRGGDDPWWEKAARSLGMSPVVPYRDRDEEDVELGELLRFLRREKPKAAVLVPTPYHLAYDDDRRAVIVHEFDRLGVGVFDASSLALAIAYGENWPEEGMGLGMRAMRLTTEDHPIFEEIEWMKGLLEEGRKRPGRKPFRDEETLRRILELGGQGMSLDDIASTLGREGRKTQTGKTFTAQNVWYYLSTRR